METKNTPTRFHWKMLQVEISEYLPIVIVYPGRKPGRPYLIWSEFATEILRKRGKYPLYEGYAITMLHDATRQRWGKRPAALYIHLGKPER